MARIFKSFQVKIDHKKKSGVPTGQEPPPPPKRELDEEEVFQELSAELLTGPANSKIGEREAPDSPHEEVKPPSTSPTGTPAPKGHPLHQPPPPPPFDAAVAGKTHVPPAADGKQPSSFGAATRKALELAALELRLKEWEQELVKRESNLSREEEKLHSELIARRKNTEEEIAKSLELGRKSGENLVAGARAEADSIRKTAQAHVEEAKNKGFKEGYALGEEKGISKGEEQGLQEGRLEWQNLIQETEMLVTELQTSRMGLLKSAEEEMVRIILAFAKRVLKVEPLSRPEIILQNIDAAINKVSEVDKIVLRINLKDKSMTESHKTEFMRRLSTVRDLQIVEDSNLQPGGIKIETGVGTIDASVETQAQELENALLKFLNRGE